MGLPRLSPTSSGDYLSRRCRIRGLFRRIPRAFLLAFITLTVILVFLQTGPTINSQAPKLSPFRSYPISNGPTCTADIETLRRNNLSANVEFARIDIEAVVAEDWVTQDTTHIEQIPMSLPANQTISIDRWTFKPKAVTPCQPPIRVRVPVAPPKVNAAHLVIGAATTVQRLEQSLEAWSHWGIDTKVRMFVLVEPHAERARVQQKARTMGFDMTVTERNETFDDRYFSLVQHLYFQRDETTRWAVVIDDDTFFLSMSRLVDRLAQYDHKKLIYLGGTSEDLQQMTRWGWMAFGGAGVFLSIPMLEELNKVYQRCYDYREKHGDQRIAWCVYAHTIVKLAVEPDLHQLDLRGDHSGFYESGRPQPLSVHHWKSWFHHDMVKMAAVSRICGELCLLQRWKFADGWYLTNGFSIVKYTQELPPGDISMEKTWDNYEGANDASYDHTLAPVRPPDPGKFSYRLEDVLVDDTEVRQFYIHRASAGGNDRVLEVVWRRATTA